MEGGRAHRSWLAVALAAALCAIAPASEAAPREAAASELLAPPVTFDRWRGVGACSYLAPVNDFVRDDGGVDVVVHFHAGQMAERQFKESGTNAVFVSCGFGLGTGPYADAFANPARFGRMMDELTKSLEKTTSKRAVHVRRLGLASWSAGFAAVSRILGVDRYYAMVDTVVLNDSLHAQYKDPNPKTAARGVDRVDVKGMRSFLRFAADAVAGRKTMVITHSAIVPPDYASSTEATQALLGAISVPVVTLPAEESDPAIPAGRNSRGMSLRTRADVGNLHVRGFRGHGPRDHFDHLYLIGEVLRSWVVPRWKRDERLVYTLAGEQL